MTTLIPNCTCKYPRTDALNKWICEQCRLPLKPAKMVTPKLVSFSFTIPIITDPEVEKRGLEAIRQKMEEMQDRMFNRMFDLPEELPPGEQPSPARIQQPYRRK